MAQPFGSFHVVFGITACAACLSYPEMYFIGLPLKIVIDHLRNICARPFSTRLSKFQAYQKLHYKTTVFLKKQCLQVSKRSQTHITLLRNICIPNDGPALWVISRSIWHHCLCRMFIIPRNVFYWLASKNCY